jgi:CheY-like chemotaxis protein
MWGVFIEYSHSRRIPRDYILRQSCSLLSFIAKVSPMHISGTIQHGAPAFPPLIMSGTDVDAVDGIRMEKTSSGHKVDVSRRRKIIVADDEQVIADTLTLILIRAGFDARAVYSGEAAIQLLERFEPDLLISDVVMCGITGVETAIVVKKLRPQCKILLFSGQAATADLLHAAREKGHSFDILTKPVHPIELLAKLQTDVLRWN